jgi:CRP-like cAMP-binding protein
VDVFQEAEMLRKVPIFGGLDPGKLKLLAFTSRALRFAPGEILMRVNEPADSAYVIIEGEAEVLSETAAGEFVVATLGKHDSIGEMGVILNGPRGATVRAKSAVRALRISGDVFLRLLTDNPECALHVMRDLSKRVTAANVLLRAKVVELETLRAQMRAAQSEPARDVSA